MTYNEYLEHVKGKNVMHVVDEIGDNSKEVYRIIQNIKMSGTNEYNIGKFVGRFEISDAPGYDDDVFVYVWENNANRPN